MTKTKTVHRCLECGAAAPKWTGQCGSCGEWNTLVEELDAPSSTSLAAISPREAPVRIGEIDLDAWAPSPTGVPEVDRVLSGGLVPGSVTLLGGEPGIGKSTLLLQTAAGMATAGRRVLYVTAEESAQQVRLRADRLGTLADDLWLVSETNVGVIAGLLDEFGPDLLVVDSIQTVLDPELGSAPGSVGQVRSAAHLLTQQAKQRGLAVVLVGHVTKDGGLAGPRVLEHLVDTVLGFEGDRHHALRMLRPVKHRFGSTAELGLFEMTGTGLVGVPDPSALFLADRRDGTAGSAVVPSLDGTRPLLVEIQALVDKSHLPVPRRSAQGLDAGRLSVVMAVLARRLGVEVGEHDVYAVTAGGAKVNEPALDLGVALAVVSAKLDVPLGRDLVVCGEIGLGGELRQVHQIGRRLDEAARLGFRRALVPSGCVADVTGLEVVGVETVQSAISAAALTRT